MVGDGAGLSLAGAGNLVLAWAATLVSGNRVLRADTADH
jgi:hypothetical protein